jgi:membrane-associated phospholipid phosphatase
VGIWLGFAAAYMVARGLADRGREVALRNARRVIRAEELAGGLFELELQRLALDAGAWLVQATNWTYWIAQFVVITAALLWTYLRDSPVYLPMRNAIIVTNTIGLVVYVAFPTAPPRLLPERGFRDTLADSSGLDFQSPLVELFANPYAAMPSLHAADAVIVGVALAAATGGRAGLLFLLWPLWVSFSLLATGNHFWLDVVAGVLLAAVGGAVTALLMRGAARRESALSPGG